MENMGGGGYKRECWNPIKKARAQIGESYEKTKRNKASGDFRNFKDNCTFNTGAAWVPKNVGKNHHKKEGNLMKTHGSKWSTPQKRNKECGKKPQEVKTALGN